MGINIKNEGTVAKARELAAIRKSGLTEVIDQALSAALELEAQRREELAERRHSVIKKFRADIAKLTPEDPRPWREIEAEMYGEFGEPI